MLDKNKIDKEFHSYIDFLLAFIPEAVGYDFTNVIDLSLDVCEQLSNNQNKFDRSVNHGGLFLPPSDKLWLQWKTDDNKDMAVLFFYEPHNKVANIVAIFIEGKMTLGGKTITYNDETLFINEDERIGDMVHNLEHINLTVRAAQIAIGSIIVLNSPYGIERDERSAHKGQARELRRQGITLRPHHIIRLSKAAPPDRAIKGEGSGKAFHFVRSHRRNYQTGKSTTVKAHFRGDPRLGIMGAGPYDVRR